MDALHLGRGTGFWNGVGICASNGLSSCWNILLFCPLSSILYSLSTVRRSLSMSTVRSPQSATRCPCPQSAVHSPRFAVRVHSPQSTVRCSLSVSIVHCSIEYELIATLKPTNATINSQTQDTHNTLPNRNLRRNYP